MAQRSGLCPSTAGGRGSNPGRGLIPHAAWHGQKNINKNNKTGMIMSRFQMRNWTDLGSNARPTTISSMMGDVSQPLCASVASSRKDSNEVICSLWGWG